MYLVTRETGITIHDAFESIRHPECEKFANVKCLLQEHFPIVTWTTVHITVRNEGKRLI